MPLYEFNCLKCNEFFELLVMNKNDETELKCPKCKSEDFERVLSSTHYTLGKHSTSSPRASSRTKTCTGGSCTTYDIPGPA